MTTRRDPAADTIGGAVVLTRVFAASRELVFRAWTDPTQVARWWGPRRFTNPVCEWDARPGGAIHVHMTGPDGTVYPMGGTFHEVAPPDRLVFTATAVPDAAGVPQLETRSTVTFADHAGGTQVTVRAEVVRATPATAGATAGMEAGWGQSLDKLANELDETAAAFVVSRDFAAPRERVYRAWTDAAHLGHWFGPKGCTLTVVANDARPGGVMHYRMGTPGGGEMWGRWVYRELTPPERLVFVVSFSDPAGGITRAPFSTDWPLETLTTLTFAEAGGKTTLTMRGVPVNATAVERAAFAAGHGSMTQGWGGTLDQLAAHLSGGQ